jgi:hypothetical protein
MESGRLAIFMEYVDGGDLRTFMSKKSTRFVDRLLAIYDVGCGLMKCQEVLPGFSHLDIKPENCLRTTNGLTKLSDFGLTSICPRDLCARDGLSGNLDSLRTLQLRGSEGTLNIGTPMYMAPEQVLGRCTDGTKADIYSLGIMALELLSGHHPFEGLDTRSILLSSIRGIPARRQNWPRETSRECSSSNRPSIGEIVSAVRGSLPSTWQTFLRGDLERIPDPAIETLRKAQSLRALGLTDRAIAVLRRSLEADPFHGYCWFRMAEWQLESTQQSKLTDEHRRLLASWAIRARLLLECLEGNDLARWAILVASVSPAHCRSGAAGGNHAPFNNWLAESMKVEARWFSARERAIIEDGGINRSLCVKCGEVRHAIVDRCPKCGFFATEMQDLYNTYLLRVSNVHPDEDQTYAMRMRTLRDLGEAIDSTVDGLLSQDGYEESLTLFANTDGQFYHALAGGQSERKLKKLFKRLFGMNPPDSQRFMRHIERKLSKM